MAILVIEEGHPNGMDLVMGRDERLNPNSRVNGGPRQSVPVIPLGDDDVMLPEIRLVANLDESRENIRILVTGIVGRNSQVVGLRVGPTILAELAPVPVATVRAAISAQLDKPLEPAA